jgi:aerobic C4-dicarboxylate transport protein
VTTAALLIGLLVVNVIKPGVGMNVDPATLDTTSITQYVAAGRAQTVTDTLLSIIPSSPVDAFARTDILQVLFFSVLFGIALNALGEKGRPVTEGVDRLAQVLFRIVGMIMHVAPIGAFGAMAFTIGSFGVRTLAQLGALIASFWLTCVLFVVVVLGIVARLTGFSLWRFVRYIREELFVAFGTSSSETVLPRIMSKLERLGCSRRVVALVVPTGYSMNLDGTSIYMAMAAVFIAQATNTPFSLGQQLGLLALLLVTSKGAAGVTGSGFVTLAATLSAMPTLPVAGLSLLVGIDRFMSEARAVTNLTGNALAAVVVSRWEGALDMPRMTRILNGEAVAETDEPAGAIDSAAGTLG